MYLSIALIILFLVLDVIIYAFSGAITEYNASEDEEKGLDWLKKHFGDTMDLVVFVTNICAGAFVLDGLKCGIVPEGYRDKWWTGFLVGLCLVAMFMIFGVLLPKKLGGKYADKSVKRLKGAVRFVVIVLYPFTFIANLISHFVMRLMHIDPRDLDDNVTEEEIITMVNEGQEQGVLEATEAEMIANIFELNDKNAADIMTHRSAIVALECHMTLEEVIQKHIDGNYSRFPVYDGDIDHIVGTLHIRDALILYRNIPNRKKSINALNGLMREAFFTPDTRDIDDLLKEMQAEKVHMGIVVDEYGQTAGLVSMEDIIEEIVGNILDEYDDEKDGIEQTEDYYLVDGLTELDELSKLLKCDMENDEYDTLNGFLISKLNRIPGEDEQPEIELLGFKFRVAEVSGNVIRKVEIYRLDAETT